MNPPIQFQQPHAGCTVHVVFASSELGYEFLQNMGRALAYTVKNRAMPNRIRLDFSRINCDPN